MTARAASLAALIALAGAGAARAHEIGAAKVEIRLAKDGSYTAVAKIDPEHVPPGPLRDPPALRAAFVDGARLGFDGAARPLVETPESLAAPLPEAGAFVLRFGGTIPAGAQGLTFRQSAGIGWYMVQVINEGVDGSASQWLEGGKESRPFAVASPLPLPSTGATIAQYVALGFEHILPKGLDHILFVLGLFLLATEWKPLVMQVTAFTVAHSITLGLAMFGAVSLPSSVVEPAIAASIVYVAVENVVATSVSRGRIVLVFLFGLLHGLGFAGVLAELGLPRRQFVPALLAFNVGVELGQLAVIAIAFLAVGVWFGRKPWYRRRVVVPGSLLIAAVGLYWTIQRLM